MSPSAKDSLTWLVEFGTGITEMGGLVFNYYHQEADNADSIDSDYLLKFCLAYALAARFIADKKEKLGWTPGSKYTK